MTGDHLEDNLLEMNLDTVNKPIIIYSFINPFCRDCWLLEPIIKKLALEYGSFFTVRPIISIHPSSKKNKVSASYLNNNLILAIKAAGLQGNKVGRSFLHKIQEAYFLYDDDLSNKDIIMKYAALSNLDLDEFSNDVYSSSAKKSYSSDISLTQEMNIKEFPSLVFFSKHNEQHNVKVTGRADYDSYVYLLEELLNKNPTPRNKPPLDLFLKDQGLLNLNDIAFIYDWSLAETKIYLNKLKLKGLVNEHNFSGEKYWSYK